MQAGVAANIPNPDVSGVKRRYLLPDSPFSMIGLSNVKSFG